MTCEYCYTILKYGGAIRSALTHRITTQAVPGILWLQGENLLHADIHGSQMMHLSSILGFTNVSKYGQTLTNPNRNT